MARKTQDEREKSNRVAPAKVVAYAIAAFVALGLALYLYQRVESFLIRDPRFALNGAAGGDDTPTLTLSGARHASPRAIEAVFSEDEGRSVYLIPLHDRRLTVRGVDWVKDATVARLWPNRLVVRVSEREPVAFVTLGPDRFGLIDSDGVILPPVHDRFKLPVLAGVKPSDSLVDRRERVHRMLRLVAELGEDAQGVSEIDVSDPDNLKISQAYEGRMLTLLMGDRNFAARYNNFKKHYVDIRRRLPDATGLDLRLQDRITVVE